MVNKKNTVLLAPVKSARDHTVQERSRLKGETFCGATKDEKRGQWLVGSGQGLTGSVHWFQLSVSVLARYDLRGLDGCQQDCVLVVVYASRSQKNQLSSNENRISEAITARTE